MFYEGRVYLFLKFIFWKTWNPLEKCLKNTKKHWKNWKIVFFRKNRKTFSGGHYGPKMLLNGFEMNLEQAVLAYGHTAPEPNGKSCTRDAMKKIS